jgi:hypothetical protein
LYFKKENVNLVSLLGVLQSSLFSVANSKQEFEALLITKGGVRGDVGSEKYMPRICTSLYEGEVFSNIFIPYM